VLLGILLAELLALLDDTTALADVELATKEEEEEEEDGVLLTVLDFELATEEVGVEVDVGVLLIALVGLELMIAGAVLVFAGAWLVTAMLGVWVVEATLSVAGTGRTDAVLVLDARIGCADCALQKSMKGANSGFA
jgi:hypothetical protein